MPRRISAEEAQRLGAVSVTATPRRRITADEAKRLGATEVLENDGEAAPEPDSLDVLKPEAALGATARGVTQGVTLGHGDEAMAAADTGLEAQKRLRQALGIEQAPMRDADPASNTNPASITKSWAPGESSKPAMVPEIPATEAAQPSLADTYRSARDSYRADNKASEKAHRGLYLGGELLGGAALPLPGGGVAKGASLAAKLGQGATVAGGLGAVVGAGKSEAEDIGGVAKDAALNGLVAAPLGAAGAALGAGFGKLGERFGAKAKGVETQWRADKIAEDLASARGAYGHSVQDAHRTMANIESKLENPNISGEWKARAHEYLASAEGKALAQQIANNALENAPVKLGAMSNARQAINDAPALANKAIDAELAKSTIKNDVLPRVMHYAKPAASALIGGAVGGPAGAGAGGMLATAIGKPGRAIANLMAKPAFQIKLNRTLQSGSGLLEEAIGAAGPVMAAQTTAEAKRAILEKAVNEDPEAAKRVEEVLNQNQDQNQSKAKSLAQRLNGPR